MDPKEIQRTEYAMRKKVVKIMRSTIEASAMQNGTDPVENLKYVKDDFKRMLKEMELPFTLLVVRAMIEGATYIRTAQKMGTITYPPEMSLGLLYLFEEELEAEKNKRLEDLEKI